MGRPQGWRSAGAGGNSHRRRVLLVSAHRLSRSIRTRTDRRLRHADRFPLQHHAGAGDAGAAQSARRSRRGRVSQPRATRRFPAAASHRRDRRHHTRRTFGNAAIAASAFDFNPVNLQAPNSPSVLTYHELQRDPQTGGNDAEVLAPSLERADETAKRLAALPEVSRALTLSSLIPADQHEKITALKDAAQTLGPALLPQRQQPAPSDQDTVGAIKRAAEDLTQAAGNTTGASADAARDVSELLKRLAGRDASVRARADAALVPSLNYDLDRLRKSLAPEQVTSKTLPPNLIRDWVLPDGRARVQALPKGNPNDTSVLRNFATAVICAEPTATGAAVSYFPAQNCMSWPLGRIALVSGKLQGRTDFGLTSIATD